ncbi:cytochrome c biogenesis protein [Synechococcus sp. PCC 7336]|uniref:cytochrome c biogenesis protein n=1 Tax=Synechococcus sp. PCC 7336 TaxID=195250 RepID=UPI00034BD527|nr:cytochrome c biogenesis protein CcsA [Synechococcus sp. PCC 7336]
MKILKFCFGLLLASLFIFLPTSTWQPAPTDGLQTLAVQLDGRKKPLDTVAREAITQMHGSVNYQPVNGEKLDYLSTYLSIWWNDRDWNREPFILVDYRPLKEAVGLDGERKYFSFQELMQSELPQAFGQAQQKQAADRDLSRGDREALTVADRMSLMLDTVANRNAVPLVPHPTDAKGTWVGIERAAEYYDAERAAALLDAFQLLQSTYLRLGDAAAIAPMAQELHRQLQQLSPEVYPGDRVLAREVFFNRLHAFGKTWKIFALAFVAMLAVTLLPLPNGYWTAMGIFVAGLGIQIYGFALRIQVADRPPVTNMYESVVWVGFGIAALATAFELRTRARYYLLAAAPLAIAALVLADSLPVVLDARIQPLVPVLRDNFWLSVHVPTIALSYACFALAMGLGHIILGHYLFASSATQRLQKLSKLNYSVLQVGVLLLAAGIILGGIWAHFSWGRFWGWDPKETWAAIALLCYLAPLHGRFVGWTNNFGLAVASVVSFNAVLMAWYGVNFVLGRGLHSYGFGTGGSGWIGAWVALDLAFVLAAALRHRAGLPASSNSSAPVEEQREPVGNLSL